MPGPPKMRLPYAPNQLRLVSGGARETTSEQSNATQPNATQHSFLRGVAYPVEQWREGLKQNDEQFLENEAFVSRYCLSCEAAEIKPAVNVSRAFYWGDGALGAVTLADNEFQLLSSSVNELVIEQGVDCALLAIKPRFHARYHTLAHAAQLGEIRLVTASRFITDAEGNQHRLLDTEPAGAPVLYREDADDNSPILQRTPWQYRNTEQEYHFDYCVTQPLAREMLGVTIKSVTVLEQYTSYFMQRAYTQSGQHAIWVPACAPVLWGWSLRVEPEQQNWVITRRKLVPPVVGSDGLELPHWLDSTLEYKTF